MYYIASPYYRHPLSIPDIVKICKILRATKKVIGIATIEASIGNKPVNDDDMASIIADTPALSMFTILYY